MTEIKIGNCAMLRAGGPKLTITQVQIDGFEYEKQRVTGTYFNNWLERYESLSIHPDAVAIVAGFEDENMVNNTEI